MIRQGQATYGWKSRAALLEQLPWAENLSKHAVLMVGTLGGRLA